MTAWRVLAGVLALTGLGAAPALARWGLEPAPTRLGAERPAFGLDEDVAPSTIDERTGWWPVGGRLLDLGLDVGPLRVMDPGATISLDLRVGWPVGRPEPEDESAFGPAPRSSSPSRPTPRVCWGPGRIPR
jgi:hypothetical protein